MIKTLYEQKHADVVFIEPDLLSDEVQDVRNLFLLSQAAAGWLIALNIGIVIAEIIAIILVIVNLEGTGKIVIAVLVRKGPINKAPVLV